MAAYFGTDYHDHFDPNVYAMVFYDVFLSENCQQKFILDCLHDTFTDGKLSGNCLLDVGSGPNVYAVISASQWFNEIVLTDYTRQCRNFLRKWLNRENVATDYKTFFEHVGKLQNCSVDELKETVRLKVKTILPCDVTQPGVLLEASPHPLYDVITSVLCLGSAAKDKPAYKQILVRLAALLKPGGHIVLADTFNETSYEFGGKTFFNLKLSKKEIYDSLIEAKLSVLSWQSLILRSDGQGIYVLKAKKE